MYIYALIIGVISAIYVVLQFRVGSFELRNWPYPLLLATFPVYYWIFAVYGSDYSALKREIGIGIAFLVIAYLAFKFNNLFGRLLLAFGYLGHALYDSVHDQIGHNQGAPLWWPEFCGSVDALLGIYLVYLAFSMRGK